MPNWQAGDIEANGIRLHYTRTGGAGPAVVLAHGFSDDGLCWTPVAEALAPEYDLVMVDARGHGRSDAPERGYGPTEQAGDLAGAMAALGREPVGAAADPEWQARQRARLVEYRRNTREELIAEQRAATPGWSEAE